jgi:dihydroxyacid dehydratase/phosphogluconate dehydratase
MTTIPTRSRLGTLPDDARTWRLLGQMLSCATEPWQALALAGLGALPLAGAHQPTPRPDLVSARSLHNAAAMGLAGGGRPAALGELLRLADAADVSFDLSHVSRLTARVPTLAELGHAPPRAALATIARHLLALGLLFDVPTCTGRSLAVDAWWTESDSPLVRPPHRPLGPARLAVLFGSLAPRGATLFLTEATPALHRGTVRLQGAPSRGEVRALPEQARILLGGTDSVVEYPAGALPVLDERDTVTLDVRRRRIEVAPLNAQVASRHT